MQKANQKVFRKEKVIEKKGNKLYDKWKRYDNSFDSWIDKKDIVWKWVNTFLNHTELFKEMLKLICPVTQ